MRHLLLQNSKVGGRLSNFEVVRKITETLETIWPKALFLLFEEEWVRGWGRERVGGRLGMEGEGGMLGMEGEGGMLGMEGERGMLGMEGKRNKGCWEWKGKEGC